MLIPPVFSKIIRPIFVVGAPRSGTSITNWALGQHPNIQPMPETYWIGSMAAGAYQSFGYGSSRGRFSHLSNVEYELAAFMARTGEAVDAIVRDCFVERCARLYGAQDVKETRIGTEFHVRRTMEDPKQRWVDATPLNSHFIWGLAQMFPSALFIHNLRRPDEVATSLEGFDKIGVDSQELQEGLQTWMSHVEQAWLGERALGNGRVFRLAFERLAAEPEPLMKELCAFLGEEYSPDCLRPLGQKINSSEVDDRRAENLKRLRDIPKYRDAESLYAQVVADAGMRDGRAEAAEELRDRFAAYCNSRPLL